MVLDQSLHLARMLRELMPDEREVWGLLALLLVTDARRTTRVDAHGRLLRLEEQDRSQWDRSAIAEAHDLIVAGLRGGRPGRYVLQAAIASLYGEARRSRKRRLPRARGCGSDCCHGSTGVSSPGSSWTPCQG